MSVGSTAATDVTGTSREAAIRTIAIGVESQRRLVDAGVT
jgi:hypothetical protein